MRDANKKITVTTPNLKKLKTLLLVTLTTFINVRTLKKVRCVNSVIYFNRLTPNDPYMGRTTPLPSKRCILYIYSTNIGTEYFKHALYSPFFSLQNADGFIMLTSWFLYYSHFIYRMC